MEPNMPQNIAEWLSKRGLTASTIHDAQLSWNGDELVIPIFNAEGVHLFNKYRRNPASSDGPKYRYEKGSTSALYNLHTILREDVKQPIFICEGELDCLLLNSLGVSAVTSTGGSGTFNKEWAQHFEGKEVYIVFDRDDAGYKGAMKAQGIIPHAKVVILHDDFEGNDITDYFQTHTLKDFFTLDAVTYTIPREPSGMPTEKKEMRKIVKEFGDAADTLLELKHQFQQQKKSVRHLIVFLQYVSSRYETFSQALKGFDRRFPSGERGDSTEVLRAKSFPLTSLIKFNYNGFAPCIWHKEKTGSMKYNKPGTKYSNTVKCFGCGAMGDPIDVVMLQRNLDFKDAVKVINDMA